MHHQFPETVKIVEVGPRDGLQSEMPVLSTATKVAFIDLLSRSGLSSIEVGSFVSAKWMPQMADTADVFAAIERRAGVDYPVLVPNETGLVQAIRHKVALIAVFIAASEAFSLKNINCSIDESLRRYESVIQSALQHGITVRAYISCVMGCPYQGEVKAARVAKLTQLLFSMGCTEVALGDTIGVGTPCRVEALLAAVVKLSPITRIAVHFHDTYGQALANCLMAMSCGVATIDAAVAGLGGCPYAQGASGNLATEDLLYMLQGMGIKTGVDAPLLYAASDYICAALNRQPHSRVAVARLAHDADARGQW